MKSYTQGRNLYGTLTKNTNSANLIIGDQLANDDYRAICAVKDWPFLEKERELTTVADQQAYNLPYDCGQVRAISVEVSDKTYVAKMCPDKDTWDRLNETTYSSDYPEWYFVFGGQLNLWPKPSTAGNKINVTQKSRVIDLSVADYTTGTITTATNGTTAIVGNGTTWTPQMVGRYIRITYLDTANTGDGLWYEISAVPSATTMTLTRIYGGTSIAAGTAGFTIGQMPLLPEAYQDLPWIYAAGFYWEKEADARGPVLMDKHGDFGKRGSLPTGRIADLVKNWSSTNTSMVIDDGKEKDTYLNPNLTINL